MKILPKIDIHVHAVPDVMLVRMNGEGFPTPPEIRKIYDSIGVEKGVLLPDGIYPPGAEDICSPREARNMVRCFPETFGWWFCPLSPSLSNNAPDTDLSFYINQYKSFSAKGVGEISENRYFDDPYMTNLFYHCEACDMPVIFHIGRMGRDYGIVDDIGLPRLEKVLKLYPKLQFLGHSQKFWAEIGTCDDSTRDGYPTGKVIPGRLPELMRQYPNLCGDLSAGSGYNAITRDPEFGCAFLEEFSSRLYYGTDICTPSDGTSKMLKLSAFLDDAMLHGKISYLAYERISRGNALDLLEK
ncbi:MAG TPA: hypothetical protein DD640_07060 [Clostridiales bacterium]|nr:hypothetical protein [Clostridiales bacterium]